ncbi:MAG: hypothetical protein Q9169_003801 [Polycauliona sp. 2 TL-2023]
MTAQSSFDRRIKAIKAVSDDEDSATPSSDEDTEPAHPIEEDDETISTKAESDDGDTSGEADVANTSFGALAKAQQSLNKRHHISDGLHSTDVNQPYRNEEAIERKAGKSDNREHLRSSKHAPVEMSSKKAVSRKREVVPTLKRDIRDPRFEPVGGPVNEEKAKKDYSFLTDYRDSEILHLKALIRQTTDVTAKDQLKRSLLSMESKRKSQQIKDQDVEIRRTHRTREKELVGQGKKPFYLKKGEQKRMALLQRFQGIRGKRLDKVIERRRKKNAQKEKKDVPEGRRAMVT